MNLTELRADGTIDNATLFRHAPMIVGDIAYVAIEGVICAFVAVVPEHWRCVKMMEPERCPRHIRKRLVPI